MRFQSIKHTLHPSLTPSDTYHDPWRQLLPTNIYFMRFPSLPTFLRTFYAFSNTTLRSAPSPFTSAASRIPVTGLRAVSMPTIPFLGALFHTAESRNMSHPVQKSDGEWQAQLSPGKSPCAHHQGRPTLQLQSHTILKFFTPPSRTCTSTSY